MNEAATKPASAGPGPAGEPLGFRNVEWEDEYRTSAIRPEQSVTDILREFYIPALSLTTRYDRMAGYFRSTSLAAASQGFSALARRGGRARFIVGCELNPGDVEAALRGADEALSARLEAELNRDGSWNPATSRGVDLLAWMVARKFLEIRVGLRVHQMTSEPMAYHAQGDGYVHEKWALFTDGVGDIILASGSFNESMTALCCNAENIDILRSWLPEAGNRIAKPQADFDHMWEHGSSGVRVVPLPVAVREKLIRIGRDVKVPVEIDGRLDPTPSEETELSTLQPEVLLRWLLIADGPCLPNGHLVGIETSPTEPWPHQRFVARRIAETWPLS